MQKENKNQEDGSSSEEKNLDKIDYTIQTMDSDLKRKSPKERSVELLELEKKEVKKEKKDVPVKKPEQKPQPKKNFNPFLDDLQPIEKVEPEVQKPKSDEAPGNMSPLSTENKKDSGKKIPTPPESFGPNSHPPVSKKKSSSFLLIFLFTLSLITVGSGVYYYYFYLDSSETEEPTQRELPAEEPVVEEVFSEKLQASQSLNVEENSSLITEIKARKETLPVSTSKYYQIEQDSENLTSSEILSSLNIRLPEGILNNLGQAWIMVYNQENTLKMNLLLEVTQSPEKTKELLINNEYRLPQLLKPLFVDEDFVLQDENIIFRDSEFLDGVRYYNLVEGFDDKAIDWSIIDNKYLIITTSKETARVLLEDARKSSPEESAQPEIKEIPIENSNKEDSQRENENQD